MNQCRVIVFSSVRMEYFSRIQSLTPIPVSEVFILTEAEYRRLAGGHRWLRYRLRFTMYFAYPTKVAWASLCAVRGDILLVSSNTFYAPLIAWACSRLSRPIVIHWLCDIFPDALVVAGAIKRGGLTEQLIGLVARATVKTCDRVVYVGEMLSEHAQRRWGRARAAFCIDNVPTSEQKFPSFRSGSDGVVGVHYGGQLGLMHDADALLQCVVTLPEGLASSIRFDFRMSGAHREMFANGIASLGLRVKEPIPGEQWRHLVRDFHIALVSLSPGGATVSLPSKVYSAMAGGLAIIAICPLWSDLGRLVVDHRCGWVINNSPFASREALDVGDYALNCEARIDPKVVGSRFATLIERLLSDRSLIENARLNSAVVAHSAFGTTELGRRWSQVLGKT